MALHQMVEERARLGEIARRHGFHGRAHDLLGGAVLVRDPQGPDQILDVVGGPWRLWLLQFPEQALQPSRQVPGRLAIRKLEHEPEDRIDGQGGSCVARGGHGPLRAPVIGCGRGAR
jgi:hypothetical protein